MRKLWPRCCTPPTPDPPRHNGRHGATPIVTAQRRNIAPLIRARSSLQRRAVGAGADDRAGAGQLVDRLRRPGHVGGGDGWLHHGAHAVRELRAGDGRVPAERGDQQAVNYWLGTTRQSRQKDTVWHHWLGLECGWRCAVRRRKRQRCSNRKDTSYTGIRLGVRCQPLRMFVFPTPAWCVNGTIIALKLGRHRAASCFRPPRSVLIVVLWGE